MVDPVMQQSLTNSWKQAMAKLKTGMMAGPDAVVSLTAAEATIVYRLLTETLSVPHPE